MTTSADNETIILLNDADLRDGYFRFYTTKEIDLNRLFKITGGSLFEPMRVTKTKEGLTTSWDCKVPVSFLQRSRWSIRKKRVIAPMSEEKKAAMVANLRKGAKVS
jgi:hypothetical protein